MHRLYNILPYPLKTLAASLNGYRIARWRYSKDTERLVAAAIDRESWNAEKLQVWQEERLSFILERAATRVPYYREYWQSRRNHGDNSSWELLENWPVLEKETLRSHPKAFLADDCDPTKMQHWQTSGSTGTPVHIWWSRETMCQWYALFEARWRRWHGVSLNDRWAILGGKLVTPVARRTPPFWVWNRPMNQLYMSAYHLAPANIPSYLEALRRYNVSYLYGYSSSLCALAQGILATGCEPPRMKVVLTNAEPLLDHQRTIISEAFRCPVRETYGMAEAVTAAGECEDGHLHLWPEAGIVEFVDSGQQVAPGNIGEILATGLINPDLPLIRYRVGDRGVRPDSRKCSCGRTLPVFPGIEGRCDDVVVTQDGRLVGRLDPVFKANLHIRGAQIIQEDYDRFTVKIVPTPGYSDSDGEDISLRLQERVGKSSVLIELVDAIPVRPNGKFRAVISNVEKSH